MTSDMTYLALRRALFPLVVALLAGLVACTDADAANPANDREAAKVAAVRFLEDPPASYRQTQRHRFREAAAKLGRGEPAGGTRWTAADIDALDEAARVLGLFEREARHLTDPAANGGADSKTLPEREAAAAATAAAIHFFNRPPSTYPRERRDRFSATSRKLARAVRGQAVLWTDADAESLNEAARVLALFHDQARHIADAAEIADTEATPVATVTVMPLGSSPEQTASGPTETVPEPDPVPAAAPVATATVMPLGSSPEPTASGPTEAVPEPDPVPAAVSAPIPAPEPAVEPAPALATSPDAASGPDTMPDGRPDAPGESDETVAAEPEPPSRNASAATAEPTPAPVPDESIDAAAVPAEAQLGAAMPPGKKIYGNSVASINDVANLNVKRERHALRFEVPAEGFTLDQVLVWWRYNDPGKNTTYSAGDGGTYAVSLHRVGSDGAPDGDALLSFVEIVDAYNRPNTVYSNYLRSRDVPRTRLEAGLYALVLDNIDSNPRANYASLNGPIWWDFESLLDDPSQADPGRPNRAALKEYENGGWGIAGPYGDANRTLGAFYMPVWAVRDSARGISIGQDIHYGEAVTSQTPIEGATKVRQRIVPTGDLDDAQLHLMVGRAAGDGPLIVRVDGRVVAEVSGLPLVPDPDQMHRRGEEHFRWISLAVPDGTVRAGREAIVELESPDGRHRICAGIRNRYYGPKDWDGRAERSVDGGAWTGWRAHSRDDADSVQLCAYFSGDA